MDRENSTSTSNKLNDADITGRQLGNYVLIRRLGRGGMANVYLAHQTTLDRPVAIKVLKPELAVDHSYVARFHREAKAAAALNSPNIVQIFEVGELDGIHFIAQEYVRGQNVRQYLNRNGVVETILAVSVIHQVAQALKIASDNGVTHRDIKPENIMLSCNGEVKVTDFGLARVMDDKRSDLTQIGITMGTPLYMSPEQAEGRHVDTRSDLYSLGITAWHMLAGHPPFDGENALAIAVKHVKEDIPELAPIRPDLPTHLCEIINKLAEKNPDDRFQNPDSLIKQLRTLEIDDIADWEQLTTKLAVEDVAAGIGAATVLQSRLEVTRQLETIMSGQFRPWWRSPWLLATIGMMLLCGGIVGAVVALSKPPIDQLAGEKREVATVPKQESAQKQFYYAFQKAAEEISEEDEEQLWLAVEQYFPPFDADGNRNELNTLYSRKADVRLGDFYRENWRYEKALKVYQRLAAVEETEMGLQTTGIAGQAVVYGFLNENERSKEALKKLTFESIRSIESDSLYSAVRRMMSR